MTTDTGREMQRDQAGRLRHLLTLDGLSRDELSHLLDLAQFYVRFPGELPARDQSLWGRTVANLFFEPSTRTRVSFELAAKRLGADVVNLDLHSSSRVKGETVLDTIYTLQAMQVDVFVMRDAEPGLPAYVSAHVAPHVSVLNAGEAHVSHPTQGLLDVLTIRQRKGELRRSQGRDRRRREPLARGALHRPRAADARRRRAAAREPGEPDAGAAANSRARCAAPRSPRASRDADVIMALRIQHERMSASDALDKEAFYREWGISAGNLRHARPDAIVMHPGPMNRGVEITSEVADGPQSVIRQQVTNGVAVRMAVLATIVRNVQERNVEAGRRAG